MKKLLTLLLILLLPLMVQSQAIQCYTCKPEGNYLLGIGKMPNFLFDENDVPVTSVMIGYENEKMGLVIQGDVRNGANYLFNAYTQVNTSVSIDTRYVLWHQVKENSPYKVGGYFQFNTTSMWLDGFFVGPYAQARLDRGRFMAMVQVQLPIWGFEQRAINLDQSEWSRFLIYQWDKDRERTRKTEHRIGVYFMVKI